LVLLNKIFFLNLKIVHVAHNEFFTLNQISLFPNFIIAVSNKVKTNLIEYFHITEQRISVIHNGLEDKLKSKTLKKYNQQDIRILYPARINNVKQQVILVEYLNNKLNRNITIDFAGEGDEKDKLSEICKNTNQFNYIGFVKIEEVINQYDFIMLYSKNEGLPLSLIEACMFQKPILANDVGGNLEILKDGFNGFKLSNFESLQNKLNQLQFLTNKEYRILASNARQVFEKKFSSKKMYSQYRNIIEEMIL
jgi:glycosyltransferase involved in cell wall biosynthesis